MRNQYRTKNLRDPISIREASSRKYFDTLFNDPRIVKNIANVDSKDKNLDNVWFDEVSCKPAAWEHLTAKQYVNQAISKQVDEPMLVRNNQDNEFNNSNLTDINITFLNTQAIHDNQVVTKLYADQLHQKNERSKRDLN